jgi:hypothetical protein
LETTGEIKQPKACQVVNTMLPALATLEIQRFFLTSPGASTGAHS